jgi:hypothetical protein
MTNPKFDDGKVRTTCGSGRGTNDERGTLNDECKKKAFGFNSSFIVHRSSLLFAATRPLPQVVLTSCSTVLVIVRISQNG